MYRFLLFMNEARQKAEQFNVAQDSFEFYIREEMSRMSVTVASGRYL